MVASVRLPRRRRPGRPGWGRRVTALSYSVSPAGSMRLRRAGSRPVGARRGPRSSLRSSSQDLPQAGLQQPLAVTESPASGCRPLRRHGCAGPGHPGRSSSGGEGPWAGARPVLGGPQPAASVLGGPRPASSRDGVSAASEPRTGRRDFQARIGLAAPTR